MVYLVFPPVLSSTIGPPASLSALVPYLKAAGVRVRSLDLNAAFVRYVLGEWPKLRGRIEGHLVAVRAEASISSALAQKLDRLCTVTLPIIDSLYRRLLAQPSTGFFGHLDHRAAKILHRNVAELTNTYLFCDLLLDREEIRCSFAELSYLLAGKHDDPLLVDFLSGFNWGNANIIGFSLLAATQLPYAVLITRALRSAQNGIRTVAGGAYVTEVIEGLTSDLCVFDDFDFVVAHEGESALLEIALSGLGDTVQHPNVMSKSSSGAHYCYLVEDIASLPAQDFSWIDLNLYPSEVALPLYSSKGCTWARCAFCSKNFLKYREQDITGFYDSVRRVALELGVRNFQLVDEEVRPERLRALAECALANPDLQLKLLIQTRFYPQLDENLLALLKRAGFSTIEFGLESASPETLKRIKKGISLRLVRRVLQDCETVGIKVILNFMIGFPWEEEPDALENLRFVDELLRRHPRLDFSCNTQAVKVYVNSDLYSNPADFGVTDSRSLPLSPITTWHEPAWVSAFVRVHGEHLLLSRRSSTEAASASNMETLTNDPHLAIMEPWFFLSTSGNTADDKSTPLLVRASETVFKIMKVNETMCAVLALLQEKPRLSDLKQRLVKYYPEVETCQTLGVLGDALTKLNELGALAFYEK